MLSFEGRIWCVAEETQPISSFSSDTLHPIVLTILGARHISDAHAFVSPSLDQLHDPFLFTQMKKACERIFEAIAHNEPIMIHGDYDADGIGGSVILYETISVCGGDVDVFLPHRDEDGYGMNMKRAQEFIDAGVRVVITCDCGISNIEETRFLQDAGIDVIITDHHQFKDTLPPAHALIHPSVPHETYPDKTLSGGGVAFKLADGLLRYAEQHNLSRPESREHFLYERLDVAAMSTIADMVPLLGESRIIASEGMKRLQTTQRYGFRVLLPTLRSSDISVETYSFGIGPKINAPGRMGNPRVAFDLLTTSEEARAYELLANIEDINKQRQKSTKSAMIEACAQIETEQQHQYPILFAYKKTWPSGIVGLIAGRLKDMFNKPTLVMAGRDAGVVGSGRSTSHVHIVKALEQVQDCLLKFGGHPAACGFSLKDPSLLPYFEERMREVVSGMVSGDMTPELHIDCEVALSDVSWELVRDVMKLEPFGMKHEKPLFLIKNVELVLARAVGAKGNTLILNIADDQGHIQKCVAFGKSDYLKQLHLGDRIDVVVELGINHYNGNQEIQCILLDLRKHL